MYSTKPSAPLGQRVIALKSLPPAQCRDLHALNFIISSFLTLAFGQFYIILTPCRTSFSLFGSPNSEELEFTQKVNNHRYKDLNRKPTDTTAVFITFVFRVVL